MGESGAEPTPSSPGSGGQWHVPTALPKSVPEAGEDMKSL